MSGTIASKIAIEPALSLDTDSLLSAIADFRERDIAWFAKSAISRADFVAAVHSLANRLPDSPYVLNVCQDRYQFMLGFFAALLRKQINVFPISAASKSVEEIVARFPQIYCLSDGDIPTQRVATLMVGKNPSEPIAAVGNNTLSFPARQTAAMVFTSGTTGEPQCVEKTWGALIHEANITSAALASAFTDVDQLVATVTPLHMYGLLQSVIMPLRTGIMIDAAQPLFPASIREIMGDSKRAKALITTPVQLRHCVLEKVELPNLRSIVCSTAPLDIELAKQAEQFYGVAVFEIFGSTETGAFAVRRPTTSATWRVLPGMSVSDSGDALQVNGTHLLSGVVIQDRVRVVDSQHFEFLGRSSELIKVGGKRTSLGELNRQLLAIPGVIDGAIFDAGLRSKHFNEIRLAALLVVAPHTSRDALLAALRERMDPVFVPKQLRFVDALPRNTAGKLPKDSLLQAFRQAGRQNQGRRKN